MHSDMIDHHVAMAASRRAAQPGGAARLLLAMAVALLPSGAAIMAAPHRVDAAMRPEPATAMLLTRLQQHYQATTSFGAKFKETITRPGMPPVVRNGVVYYQKPGKLRLEFEGPQPETIVSDGRMIYDYDPALNQVVETRLKQASRSQPAVAFLLGVGNLRRDFLAEAAPAHNSDDLTHLLLRPKSGGEPIGAGIDTKTYNIMTLTLENALGNRTELSFSQIERNRPLNAAQFEFTPPSGADIVSSQEPR